MARIGMRASTTRASAVSSRMSRGGKYGMMLGGAALLGSAVAMSRSYKQGRSSGANGPQGRSSGGMY